jgi:3-hydroxyisobutyrate dehydrogenase-like beta-hydroxyacid dehydrogenase
MVMQALSESLTFARREGIPDDIFFQALGLNVSRSGVADLKEPLLRKRAFAPQFSLKHMHKDLGLALADGNGSALPQVNALKAVYDRGMDAGFGEEDFSVLIRLLESKTPVGPRAPASGSELA